MKEHPVIRSLFFMTAIWGVSIIWIAPRPPMVDLAQHAGQVSLLHDLVTGTSPWSDLFRINLFTPYLIGYGLAFPLSFIMPAGDALKVVLSLAYFAFVFSLLNLRKHFNADPRLDWLFLLPFFGLSYYWGFFTFLTAAPVAIFFILIADRYSQQPSLKRGMSTMLMGLILLLSHGLTFLFGMAVAGSLYTVRCYSGGGPWMKRWARGIWPLVIPGLVCIAYYLLGVRMQEQYGGFSDAGGVVWEMSWKRLPKFLINSIGDTLSWPLLPAVVSIVLLAVPWMLGLRINRRCPAAWVMLGVTLLISMTLPGFMMATGLIYSRFALFAFPAYALIFALPSNIFRAADKEAFSRRSATHQRVAAIGMLLLITVTWMSLARHSLKAWAFAQESTDFEAVLSVMEPGQRAIALPFADRSQASDLEWAYHHYAAWYQSEKQGLVDFNFAWFPPQIVRFRPDQLPAVKSRFAPADFDTKKHRVELYRYILARHIGPLPSDLFKGAECAPVKLLSSGAWTIFERRDCHTANPDNQSASPLLRSGTE